MALARGTRIGVYEVTAPIGEGGMGQVFRARDTKLNRDVALKVLPDAFASDPERLARFTREAQTLASLNHPNIAHIHGLEESSGVRALVMELVEGEDLSQRIARGPIALDDTLPMAKQIAEALEAAHEQGIVHRDLKPANIKVRADGTVKVLDFGLAKALEPGAGSSPNVSQSPTITTPAMTRAGIILGTAAYMSPEQARGKTVDRRADIWAFGVVVFEMLTGRKTFPGENATDIILSVVSKGARLDRAAGRAPGASPIAGPLSEEGPQGATAGHWRGARADRRAAQWRDRGDGYGGQRLRRTATRTGAALGVVARAAMGVGRLDARARDRVGAAVGALARRESPAQHRAPVYAVVVRARRANRCRVVPRRESRGLRGAAEGSGLPDGKTTRDLPGQGNGMPYAFSADGQTLYGIRWVADRRTELFRVSVAGGSPKTIGPLGQEYLPQSSLYPGVRLSLAPDGKSVTYSTLKHTSNLWLAEGLDAVTPR